MPSRKQRRRRAKDRRHEYEYVYVDSEGKEVEVDPAERANGRAAKPTQKGGAGAQPRRRPARVVQPPSWRRVGRRAVIYAPLILIVVFLLGRKLSTGQKVLQAVVLAVVLVPVIYLTDSLTYRAYQRRMNSDKKS